MTEWGIYVMEERPGQHSLVALEVLEQTSHSFLIKKQENIEDCFKTRSVFSYQGREHFVFGVKFCALMHTECLLISEGVLLTRGQTLKKWKAIRSEYRWQNLILLRWPYISAAPAVAALQ